MRRLFIIIFFLTISVETRPAYSDTLKSNLTPKIIIEADEIEEDHLSSFLNILHIPNEKASETVAHFLKSEKGVSISSHGDRGSLATVDIRGTGKSERILVLLDGIRLNKAQGSGADLSQIPLSIIEKIEIIRGGESAFYGADAVGGVINMVTRKNKPIVSYALSRDLWKNNTSRDHVFTLSAGRKFLDQDLFLSVHSEKNQGNFPYVNSITGRKENRNNNESSIYALLIKTHSSIGEKTSISFMQELSNTKRRVPGSLDATSGLSFALYGQQKEVRSISELKSTYTFSKDKNLSFSLPLRSDALIYQSDFGKTVYKNIHVGPKMGLSFPLSTIHLIDLLGEVTFDTLKSLSHSHTAQKINWAAVIKDDMFLTPSLTISPIVRFDYTKHLYAVINPKWGVTYKIAHWLSIKSNASRNFRSPSFDELYYNEDSAWFSYQGNPHLKPETSWDSDVGFTIDQPAWKTEHTFFITSIKDLISNKTTISGIKTIMMSQNLDQNFIWGTESSIESKLPIFNDLYGTLNHTWLRSDLPYRPPHRFNSILKWEKEGNHFFISHQYISSVKTHHPLRSRLPIVQLFDVGTALRLSNKIVLSAKIENIFNYAYERVAYYPMPGRIFHLSISGTL